MINNVRKGLPSKNITLKPTFEDKFLFIYSNILPLQQSAYFVFKCDLSLFNEYFNWRRGFPGSSSYNYNNICTWQNSLANNEQFKSVNIKCASGNVNHYTEREQVDICPNKITECTGDIILYSYSYQESRSKKCATVPISSKHLWKRALCHILVIKNCNRLKCSSWYWN